MPEPAKCMASNNNDARRKFSLLLEKLRFSHPYIPACPDFNPGVTEAKILFQG